MKIAVLGAGLLGRPMAERLNAAGHAVHVFNRTRAKIADLSTAGIAIMDRPEEALAAASCVILMLADAPAIREVILLPASRQALAGRTIIQMGTIGPDESVALQREVQTAGGDYFEAPVLGSIAEVRAGKLMVMVGAEPDQYSRWADLLAVFGPPPRLIGPVGRAAALKLALNHFIAAETAAFALSVGLVERRGIPVETFMAILRDSALYAPTFDKKLSRMLKRDYSNPNFSTAHLLKDVTLFLNEARARGLNTASLDHVPLLLQKTIEKGFSEADYSALYEAVNPPA